MSLEDFLKLPEDKPYAEYLRGEVVRKPMPNDVHSATVKELLFRLESFVRVAGIARVDTELRHLAVDEQRVYLPDVSVTLLERWPSPSKNPVEVPPDLAVEVLSPDDRAANILDKVDFYLRIGVRQIWVVDPEGEAITVYRRGDEPHVVRSPGSIDAAPVLEPLRLPVAELFAAVRGPR